MPEKSNTKSRGLYTLRMHTDHLIMFAHPNENVLTPFPQLQTNNGTLSHHGCPLFTSSTTHTAHQTQREAGPDDQLHHLGLGMFLYTQFVVSFN